MAERLLCCTGSLEGGGSERQLWQLATRIDRSKFVPAIHLQYRSGVYLDRVPTDVEIFDFWSSRSPSDFKIPGQIHRAQVADLVEVIQRERPAIVYDRTFHSTLVTAPACRKSNVPRVSVIVSPPSRDFSGSGERFAWLKKRQLRQAYSDSTAAALAVSASVADDAAEFYGIDRDMLKVLPSPVDIEGIQKQAMVKQDVEDCSFRVLVVGRLSDEKGQSLAIDAFAQADNCEEGTDWRLDIVGDGPAKESLMQRATSTGVGRQIHFHGFLENPYPWIAAADLLLIPSKYEGLPNVALEAMALRTALVTTDCSRTLTAAIGDNELGEVVGDRKVESLTTAIIGRATPAKVWDDRIRCASRYVASEHSFQKWMKEMESLLRNQIERFGGGKR